MAEQAELADLLFSGLAERPMWQSFLQRLADRLGGDSAAFLMAAGGAGFDAGAVLAPAGKAEGFAALIGAPALAQLPFDEPALVPLSRRDDAASGPHAVALRLRLDQGRSAWLVAVPAPPGQGLPDNWAADWSAVLAGLQPLLARMMPVYLLIGDVERRRLIAEYVLESGGVGVILVDAEGTVISANAAARAIMDDGAMLAIADGRIRAARRPVHKALMDQVGRMAAEQSAAARPDRYAVLPLLRDDQPLPVTAIVRPGPPFGPMSAPLRRTAVIVLRDPARRPRLSGGDLERLFGLSPAEARLAGLLAEGLNTEEAARQLGISRHTVRTQLQAIYLKTGTNRQGELVRMLLSSAATLAQA